MNPGNLEWREPLWLLLALWPLLQGTGRLLLRRRTAFADAPLLPWLQASDSASPIRSLFSRNSAWLLGWLLLSIALAGPRERILSEIPAEATGGTVMAVVDLSRSMQATDLLPDRRRRAAIELHELLRHADDRRIGIIVFAGRPHLYLPPTSDHAAVSFFLETLPQLRLPTLGSDLAGALELAASQLADQPDGQVVVLSDGDLAEEGVSTAIAAARQLAAAGLRLELLGTGATGGEAIPLSEGGWLVHEGQPVITRLNERLLQRLAEAGAGRYQRIADDDSEWRTLLAGSGTPGATRTGLAGRWQEYFPRFLLPAIVLLFLAIVPGRYGRAVPLATGLLWLMLLPPGEPLAAETVAPETVRLERAADRAWQAGEFEQAANYYARLPGYRGLMGAGASHYRLEAWSEAAGHFGHAVLAARDDAQRADALFNLGNSLFKQGDYTNAAAVFADVQRYRDGDTQAEHNRALSLALQAAVSQRLEARAGRTARAGRGPRSATAEEGVQFGESSSLSLGGETSPNEPPGELPPLPPEADPLIALGVARFELSAGEGVAVTSPQWQQELAEARLLLEGMDEQPALLWRRLLEVGEGFPAPLPTPRPRPGLEPW